MPSYRKLPGINIQWPWSDLIISGKKSIETRSYALPSKFIDVDIAVIETPGPCGKKSAGIEKARIVGTVRFSKSIEYKNKKQWLADQDFHLVAENDPVFFFSKSKPKWGWVISRVEKLEEPVRPPSKRGIVFAKDCKVPITRS